MMVDRRSYTSEYVDCYGFETTSYRDPLHNDDFLTPTDLEFDDVPWSEAALSPVSSSGFVGFSQPSGASPAITGLSLGPLDEDSESLFSEMELTSGIDVAHSQAMPIPIATAQNQIAHHSFDAHSLPVPSVTLSLPELDPFRPPQRRHTDGLDVTSTRRGHQRNTSAGWYSGTSSPIPGMKQSYLFPTRTGSLKRSRTFLTESSCSCVCPDRGTEDQRTKLNDLPMELLLIIFEYAFLTPDKPPRCIHDRSGNLHPSFKITRRATTSGLGRPFLNHIIPTSIHPTATQSTTRDAPRNDNLDEPDEKTEALRVYRAKTLLNIMLTCERFYRILADNESTDVQFWRNAARWCWKWLPSRLGDVQGRDEASQTSWRNLVAVFMRSENGLFGKKGGGKGGVECFGGKRDGKQALSWSDFKRLQRGEKRRMVVLVCAQPGPDIFSVIPREDRGGWLMSIRGMSSPAVITQIDTFGRFSQKPELLPSDLIRNTRCADYYQPDIFVNKDNRLHLSRADIKDGQVRISVDWNLGVIPKLLNNTRSSVARAVSFGGMLMFTIYSDERNPATLELRDLLDPLENHKLYCVEASLYEDMPGWNKVGKKSAGGSSETIFRWYRGFEYSQASTVDPALGLHHVICNMAVNKTYAVALVRWNIRTLESSEELVHREFHVMNPLTGETLRVLEYPNLCMSLLFHSHLFTN